jgi:exopolysaccharide biosynthesis polyprenyl glycosylphosphotransferase
MPWTRHRLPLIQAAALDGLGLVVLAVFFSHWRGAPSQQHVDQSTILALLLIYWSLAWLFGTYTLLKWRRVSWAQALVRLASTATGSIAMAAVLAWVIRAPATAVLLHRSSLIPLFSLLVFWSGLIRVVLRRLWPLRQGERWQIVALATETEQLRREWTLTPNASPLPSITSLNSRGDFAHQSSSDAVALSPGVTTETAIQPFCQKAVGEGKAVTSLVEMAEWELQRIPTRWVGNQWLLFSSRIDGQRSTLQKQLKRYADVVISLLLLLVSTPLLILAALLVKAQDGGPALFRQRRTGLLGQPFDVLKIRTMVPRAETSRPRWAEHNDSRITPVGYWLRRTRLDELPQLLNVLRGEMSLIGPRPERPEFEEMLEAHIPNYRLRHWIRPGLSGWAQVNMPYASSVEDAELKLSYDLYYLRNASLWLDLMILAKTIKLVLKAGGR